LNAINLAGVAVVIAGLACSGSAFAQSATEKPGYEKPSPEKWAGEKPGAEKWGSEKPAADKWGSEKPASEKWAAEKPAADKWGSEKSTADKSGSEKSAADRLTQIEAETLVLKAREKQIDAQAAILTKQNEIAMKRALNDQLSNKTSSGDPVVRSIEGIGRAIYATLQLNNGSMIEARAGDVLPNGMKVVSVRPNEVVVLSRNKRRIRLAGTSGADSNWGYTRGAVR
jgi:type IV pilus biogenesis protein PilP